MLIACVHGNVPIVLQPHRPAAIIEESHTESGCTFSFQVYDVNEKELVDASIVVSGANGKELAKGKTDLKGQSEFSVPCESPVKIIIDANAGKVIFKDFIVKENTKYSINIIVLGEWVEDERK